MLAAELLGLPPSPVIDRLIYRIAVTPQKQLSEREPCWLWQGRLNRNGYGRAYYAPRGKEINCHTIMYCELIGPVPDGKILDHLCRQRHCCNPWHVEPVTHRENTLRGNAVLFSKETYQQISLGI